MFPDRATFVDRPFGCPLDTVLDIPVPPSVNETRRINRAAIPKVEAWQTQADRLLMASGQHKHAMRHPVGDRVEITIILCELKCALDADNPIKSAIDYLRRVELIRNDDKKYVRRIVIEWGEAPEGCRIVLRGAA